MIEKLRIRSGLYSTSVDDIACNSLVVVLVAVAPLLDDDDLRVKVVDGIVVCCV
jgi:hypothetical protein